MRKTSYAIAATALYSGLTCTATLFSMPVLSAIEEVVVTATRRAESLEDVPLAVSAMTGDELTKSGVFSTSDLNRSAPNLQVSSAYGEAQPNFSVRGVGVGTEYNANAASPVGVYVDQVYQTFRASHGQQLFDMEQIEIVRGPQGTLYGRNTTGGAVNFITNKPDLAEANGNIIVGIGNYNRRNIAGAYEFTPIEDTLGVRVAGTWVEYDSYNVNKLDAGLNTFAGNGASGLNYNSGEEPGGYDNFGLRGAIRWAPTSNVDLMVKAYTGKSTSGTEVPIATGQSKSNDIIDYYNSNFLFSQYFQNINGNVPGTLPESYSKSARGLGIRDVEVDSVGKAKIESDGLVFTADVAISEETNLIAVLGYDQGAYHQDPTTDCDGTPLAACSIGYNSEFEATNIDVRIDHQNGRVKFIAGAFYGQDSITNDNKPNFFNFTRDVNAVLGKPTSYWNPGGLILPTDLPTGITGDQHNKQERESVAVYGEVNFEVTDDVNLTVGLRYSDDTLEYSEGKSVFYDDAGTARAIFVSDFVNPMSGGYAPYFLEDVYDSDGVLVGTAAQLNGGASTAPNDLKLKDGSEDVSGRVIVDWHITDSNMVYASYSRGYRAGTMNGLSYASANQVYFVEPEEVDAFEVGVKARAFDDTVQINAAAFYYDYKGQQGQVVDGSATAFLVSLDGKISGVEAELIYAPTDTLTIKAALGYLKSEYDNGACPPAGLTGFQQGNCINSSAGAANVGGNSFPYAAKTSLNLGFDWDIAQAGEGTWTLHGDAAYTGEYYYDAFEEYNDPTIEGVSTGKYSEGDGDYWIYNARLAYETADWTVALWVKNLTDEEYYPFGISIENLFGNGYRMIAPPRTFGVEAQRFF